MDHIALSAKVKDIFKKYRYALLILLLGVGLMLWPSGKGEKQTEKTPPVPQAEVEADMEKRLEEILGQIQGAGRVRVLLSVGRGEQTLYQSDTDVTSGENGSTRTDTVIVSGSDRAQQGLVQQVNPPSYLGAVVVCQGADHAAVRLAIVEAVASVTGLGADRISVLKMK